MVQRHQSKRANEGVSGRLQNGEEANPLYRLEYAIAPGECSRDPRKAGETKSKLRNC